MSTLSRSQSLDAVRGVAVLGVVVWHYWGKHPPDLAYNIWIGHLERVALLGRTGVDLFFVLSGYLLGGILMDHRDSPTYYSAFYGRRLLRIGPLYLLLLALFLGLVMTLPWQSSAHSTLFSDWAPAWSYLALMQNNVGALRNDYGPGILAVTWSLAVEEQFYLLLPLLIRSVPKATVGRVCLALMVSAPIWRAALMVLFPDHPLARYLTLPAHFDTLFGGVWVAWLKRHPIYSLNLWRWRRALVVLLAMLALGLGWMAKAHIGHTTTPGFDVWAYSYFAALYVMGLMVIVSGLRAPMRAAGWRTPLVWLGVGAYSIYLFHRPVQALVEVVMGYQGWLPTLLSVPAVCLLGWVCWVVVERPCINFGRERFQYRLPPIRTPSAREFGESPPLHPQKAERPESA